jgi:hypothetical protein
MIRQRTRLPIRILHWTVGLVVLLESYRTFHAALTLHEAGHSAALWHARLVLSGCEIVAALLFLLPMTTVVGGYSLLAVFGLAVAIHTLHGDLGGLEILGVYAAAVWVTLTSRGGEATEVSPPVS